MASITAANAIYQLGIAGLYDTPQQLQGFSTDDIYTTQPVTSVQTQMGVDGILSGGFVYVEFKQSIMLQADSESNDIFDNWWQNMQAQQDALIAGGTVLLPGISKTFAHTRGFLTGYQAMPDAAKLLKPRKYEITWQKIASAPTGF